MEHITLYYRQGSSDKTYATSIQPQGDGYVVQFQYGRRGSALQSGQKNPVPLSYDQAKRLYDQLVASKVAKGYTPDLFERFARANHAFAENAAP